MSDGNNEQQAAEAQQPAAEEPQQAPFIKINVTRTGLNVETNVRNPIMLYGLLEGAKDSIRDNFGAKKEEPLIAVPSFIPPKILRP